jgi:hypothetical protein
MCVCVVLCVYMCVCIYMYIYINTCKCLYSCMCMYTPCSWLLAISLCLYLGAGSCLQYKEAAVEVWGMRVCVVLCSVYMCVCVYICKCSHSRMYIQYTQTPAYIHTYTHTHIHTHIHTYGRKPVGKPIRSIPLTVIMCLPALARIGYMARYVCTHS